MTVRVVRDFMPEILKKPLSFYVELILKGQPYSFARYGDGEWASALGKRKRPQKNCDGHIFFQEMRDDLRGVLRCLRDDPETYDYMLGMQNMAMRMWGKQINEFLRRYGLQDRSWHNADVFHHASRKKQLGPLIEALKQRSVVLVGPAHLGTLDKVFGYNEIVKVPRQNCYLQLDAILTATRKAINRCPKPVVVSISASMPAEIIIHRLYRTHGRHAFLIDFGSVFDPYVGVASRKYHQGIGLDAIRAINPGAKPRVAAGSVKSRRAGKIRRASRR